MSWKSLSSQIKMFIGIGIVVTSICAILLIAIAATPSYYHRKFGGYETQSGAWQYCVKTSSVPTSPHMSTMSRHMNTYQAACGGNLQCICQLNPSACAAAPSGGFAPSGGGGGSIGTGCTTQDVSNADDDTKNTYQSIRAFLVLGILLSFAVIALPIVAIFIPSYGSILCMLAGVLSIVGGFCLLISWAIVAGKKADGVDLFWGFGLQVVITVALWIVGVLLGMAGMNMKGNQVTSNLAKHQADPATKQDVHNQLAASWQQTQKTMPQQQTQPQYGYAQQQQPQYPPQPQYGYGQQPPQYNPIQQQAAYSPQPQQQTDRQAYGQTPITPNPVYNANQNY